MRPIEYFIPKHGVIRFEEIFLSRCQAAKRLGITKHALFKRKVDKMRYAIRNGNIYISENYIISELFQKKKIHSTPFYIVVPTGFNHEIVACSLEAVEYIIKHIGAYVRWERRYKIEQLPIGMVMESLEYEKDGKLEYCYLVPCENGENCFVYSDIVIDGIGLGGIQNYKEIKKILENYFSINSYNTKN